MKKKVILLLIQLSVVTLVLVLTLTTYAWFSSNLTVGVGSTTITASHAAYLVMGEVDEKIDPYMGQTGTGYPEDDEGGVDAPYQCSKTFTLAVSGVAGEMAVKLSVEQVTVTMYKAVTPTNIDTEQIAQLFTIRVKHSGTEGLTEYEIGENGYLKRLDSDGAEDIFLLINDEVNQLSLELEIIFLSEKSYLLWQDMQYDEVTPFAFCSSAYMRSVFRFLFSLSLGEPSGGAA